MQEQITIVSMKTPSACTKPWLDGWCGTGVAAAAMFGAEPMPASLEKSPRFTPFSIAAATPPTTPPADLGEAEGVADDVPEHRRHLAEVQ